MLEVQRLVLGPVSTNAYLVGEPESGQAVVIDPAASGEQIYRRAEQADWSIESIWLTHTHFDHFAGAADLLKELGEKPIHYRAHPGEKELWSMKGGAEFFGYEFDPGPVPAFDLEHGQMLSVGNSEFEVRHAPGHSAGHVMFYCRDQGMLFSGDVIFRSGIGRTDLLGGDFQTLISSIRDQVLSLPGPTVIYPGHGPETTVGEERKANPYLR